jgi:hypothetical protein
MDDPTNRPSRTPDGRASLSAMARAQRSSPSQPPPPPSPRVSVPDSPFVSAPSERAREALPPPYDDASGFIDLDKLRAEAAAQAAARPPSFAPPPPAQKGARTPPPVAASIFATAEPVRSGPSQTMGMIIGGSIAAAGLVAAFFIVSRGNSAQDTRAQSAAQRPIAMNAAPAAQPPSAAVNAQPATNPQAALAVTPAPQPAAAPPPVGAAPHATAEADPGAAAAAHAAPAATAAAAPRAASATEAPGSVAAAPAREPSSIDSSEHAGKRKADKAAGKVAARGAKSETAPQAADAPAYEVPKEAPAAGGNSFLQQLGKTPELAGQAAAAPPKAAPAPAAEPAPAPPALPPPSKEKPGLASAVQKADTAQEAPPAAAAAAAAAAPKAAAAAPAPASPPAAGVPDTPSPGAIASALQANNRAAKACVKGQEAPSRASITFGSDGKVQSISVSGPAVGTPAEECIKQALQKGNVGPFAKPSFTQSILIRP